MSFGMDYLGVEGRTFHLVDDSGLEPCVPSRVPACGRTGRDTLRRQRWACRLWQPTFFVIDGHELTMILSDDIGLKEFLRQRQRLLAEEGLVVVPYCDLFSGSRHR
jgi:hypothetical protein